MPGPSNSRKKRKSQGKARHQRKPSSGSSPSIISLYLKDVKDASEAGFHGEEQGEERRRSVASDLSVDTTGLRTPGSPVVSGPQDEGSVAFGKTQAVGEVESSTIIFPDYATDDSSTTHEETPCLKVEQLVSIPASEWQQLPEGLPTYAPSKHDDVLLKEPCIHDSGNGPRVRNTREFLASRFFAHPPALEDPLRAEFSQVEVLQMLKTVLPEEMALILWYNKSRATSRICPACHRLYLVGDVLSDAIDLIEENPISDNPPTPPTPSFGIHPQLRREQDLSGLCSSICFILASVAQCDPLSIKATWGHTADEIDDKSWSQISQSPGDIQSSNFRELTMVLRMTRLHDLGLRQLCFPDLDLDKPTCDDFRDHAV